MSRRRTETIREENLPASGVVDDLSGEPRVSEEPAEGFGTSSFEDVKWEPVVAIDGATAEPAKKRRGRPPGSGTRISSPKTKAEIQVSVATNEKLASGLFMIHMAVASYTGIPELMLATDQAGNGEKGEALDIVNACQDVAKFYNMELDPKVVAWGNLLVVLGSVYGGKLLQYKHRIAEERKDGKKPTQTAA